MTNLSSRRDFLKDLMLMAGAAQIIGTKRLAAAAQTPSRHYINIAPQAGIHFIHNNGAFGKKYLPETMGSGCAFIDYDNDGWDDIYVTALGEARLFHNEHNGTFRDVTREAGVNNTGFGASAAWFDYDKDGKLDLFVCNYVDWTEKTDIYCSLDGAHKSYCTPEAYKGQSCRLFHNLGGGRFEDVTKKAGIYDPTGKNLGVAIVDYDMDGWPDIAVSDDTQPNKLYHNNHNGTFTQDSVQAGIAYDANGVARGAMGIDASDFDR